MDDDGVLFWALTDGRNAFFYPDRSAASEAQIRHQLYKAKVCAVVDAAELDRLRELAWMYKDLCD